jgi:hypothetical protein
MQNKKFTLWAVVVLVVVLALVLVIRSSKKPQSGTGNKPASGSLQVTKTEVPPGTAPQGFPADIPIEAGAKITQNYNATAGNGLFQATRVFDSSKSMDQNFAIYSDYLKSAGWTVVNTLNLSTTKVLAAKKGAANLQITIAQNTVTKVISVSISYSEQK